jgi:hypothetical protein
MIIISTKHDAFNSTNNDIRTEYAIWEDVPDSNQFFFDMIDRSLSDSELSEIEIHVIEQAMKQPVAVIEQFEISSMSQ